MKFSLIDRAKVMACKKSPQQGSQPLAGGQFNDLSRSLLPILFFLLASYPRLDQRMDDLSTCMVIVRHREYKHTIKLLYSTQIH